MFQSGYHVHFPKPPDKAGVFRGLDRYPTHQKFRLGQGAVTAAEQAFMQYAPNGLGAGIRTLARHDEGMARLFVEQAAPVIAVEMTQVILNDLLFAVEQAAG